VIGRLLAALALVALFAGAASGDTHRIAVVVGNNVGGPRMPPLRFAEDDAAKVGRVMVELGGVAAGDLFLVKGGNKAAVEAALARASARIAARRRAPGGRVVLFFYFSGHSDGVALELGRDRLDFGDLRRWLATTGAEVRLALVDTCKSGALLAAKGGAPGPAFHIRLSEELSSSGEALLTSSAADEVALESREIGGSFFTHHLVSGLRGAADTSGDSRVTLSEAYQYAYAHTITTTGATLNGPQHPAYDYRLTGRGELVLTDLSRRTARLEVPPGARRVLIVDEERREAIAELALEAPRQVAVAAGRYTVRAWLGGKAFQGTIRIAAGETRVVRWSELAVTTSPLVVAKGSPSPWFGGPGLWIAMGGQGGFASDLDLAPSLRVGVTSSPLSGISYGASVATGRAGGFRETAAFALVGYRLGWTRSRFEAWIGGEAGPGAIIQQVDGDDTAWSGALALVPRAGAGVRVAPRLSIGLDSEVTVTVLRRDGGIDLAAVPALRLGLRVSL
jgi:hypothetical protein